VAASRDLIRANPQRAKDESLRISNRYSSTHSVEYTMTERKLSRLSKIAHKLTPGKNSRPEVKEVRSLDYGPYQSWARCRRS